jgi:hypothetical protein
MLEPGIGIICAVEDGAGGYDVTNAIVEDVPPSTSTSFQVLNTTRSRPSPGSFSMQS